MMNYNKEQICIIVQMFEEIKFSLIKRATNLKYSYISIR